MKDRPVIFNGEMIRAILDGRKTQTRRVINPQPTLSERTGFNWKGYAYGIGSTYRDTVRNFASCFNVCPFGQIGDLLWVRETWQGPLVDEEHFEDYRANADKFQTPAFCEYAADGGTRPEFCDLDDNVRQGWRPSIHMPRWASRILLEITAVRVERLNSISEGDAMAEGVRMIENNFGNGPAYCDYSLPNLDDAAEWYNRANDSFKSLWKSIYGAENWSANPWVWVIEFKRVEAQHG